MSAALVAHGGTGGLIVESVLVVGVALVLAAAWWRSRRTPGEGGDE